MARRAGKAASRKARQRSASQRANRPAVSAPRATAAEPTAPMEPMEPIPPVGTPDAREAASLDPPRRTAAPPVGGYGSTLTKRERAEYHYVERDLRNIGILTAVMAALLLVAWLAFSALNLTG
ncbi:MAG: hypothetical protein ABR593_04575 [Candidatus Limnocylindria bacterium]